jgi:thiamine-monophosphate kinase
MSMVPVDDSARRVAAALGGDAAVFALKGGEDFELLFTVQEDRLATLTEAVTSRTGTPVTVIGEIVDGSGVTVVQKDGRLVDSAFGFDHFR